MLCSAGLEFRTGAARLDLAKFVSLLHENRSMFRVWLKKISIIAKTTAFEDAVDRVFVAFVFAMYRTETELNLQLLNNSKQLALMITMTMRAPSTCREAAAKLIIYLERFCMDYDAYRFTYESEIKGSAMKEAVFHAHQVFSNRRRALELNETFLPSLFKRVSIVLCTTVDIVRKEIMECEQMKRMQTIKNNPFWGNGGISVFRLMHELLIDGGFALTLEAIFPEYAEKYASGPNRTCFVDDFKAVITWPIWDASTLWTILSISAPVVDTANRIIPLMSSMTPEANLEARWQAVHKDNPRLVADFLVFAARTFRLSLGVLDEEQCRRSIVPNTHGFHQTAANILISKSTTTKNTVIWLRKVLGEYRNAELQSIMDGDPYALLSLHDHTIIDFALNGDFNQPPETLAYDMQRLASIRLNITGMDRQTLRELVNNNNHSPAIQQLRNIVFVSRFQHGDTISIIAREIAEQRLGIDEVFDEAVAWWERGCD